MSNKKILISILVIIILAIAGVFLWRFLRIKSPESVPEVKKEKLVSRKVAILPGEFIDEVDYIIISKDGKRFDYIVKK